MASGKQLALDFRRTRIVKGHGLSLAERLRAARRVPQAIVKVASYGQGLKEAMGQVSYISRKGKLELETDQGDRLTTLAQQKAVVHEWARDFGHRKNSRDTVNIVFSMPNGSDPEALRRSVRKVLERRFPDHEAVFGIHEEKKHPHAHVVMKMRGRNRKTKLDLRKEDLHHLREVFAEAAREEGVEMAVSPRAARGVGRKGTKRTVYHLRQKKIVPKAEKQTAQDTVVDLQKGSLEEKPWEKAMLKRNRIEREAYQAEAGKLRAAARQTQVDRETLLRAAADLERFAKTMPTPKTLRQTILEKLGQDPPSKSLDRPKSSQSQDGLDR